MTRQNISREQPVHSATSIMSAMTALTAATVIPAWKLPPLPASADEDLHELPFGAIQ